MGCKCKAFANREGGIVITIHSSHLSKLLKLFCLETIIVLFLSGCGADKKSQSAISSRADSTVTIAASFYPLYIFALNIAQDIPDVRVVALTEQTAGCLHDYALTPEDLKKLDDANILITNGAGLESFMAKITNQRPDLSIIESSKGIELLQGDGDAGDNPHVWVSISNAMRQVQTIGDQLAFIDPAHAVKYRENTQTYIAKLEAQRTKMHLALDGLTNRKIVTFHEAFPYFAQEFDFQIVAVIEREPGSAPSAKELGETIDLVNDLQLTALFAEPQYPAKAAETIATATGAKVYILDPVVTGPIDVDAYTNSMDQNLAILLEALQ